MPPPGGNSGGVEGSGKWLDEPLDPVEVTLIFFEWMNTI